MSRRQVLGAALLAMMLGAAAAAPALAPNPPWQQFPGMALAPPMLPRVIDASGRLRAPCVYPLVLQEAMSAGVLMFV